MKSSYTYSLAHTGFECKYIRVYYRARNIIFYN